ncbi:MAG: FMN-binding protein [Hamadaea sp.]|uniref:FMN-binding protein n=1 Tax=Hamadaea sp. TaxID=2024425 RepID=UPI0017E5093E|nr:FMN-binding protein [Hamadaea sp.]NUR73373.1 FMN-binding protein [Hamadaea sp.]NUT18520.1 FMN-binding protein [Hamadaea sp.]
MRRITLWLLSTVAITVLLFSYRTSTMGSGGGDTVAVTPANNKSNNDSGGSTAGSTQTGTSTGNSTGSKTYEGSVAQTRWGPVQVRITVANGKITDVEAIEYPTENHRDQEINQYALPILHDSVISKQSAQIDTVSGATVTSEGYIESLQAALDSAHLS